jgi:hypothetical protein
MVDVSAARNDVPDGTLIGDIQGLRGRARHVRKRGRDRRARTGLPDYRAFGEALVVRAEHRMTGYAQVGHQGAPGRSPNPRGVLSGQDGAAYGVIDRLRKRPRAVTRGQHGAAR